MKTAVFLCVFAVALPLRAGEPLAMRVSPTAAFEPAVLTVRTIVEADTDNRALEVIVASRDFYRSSWIQLDGASAEPLNLFEFKNLPTGTYEVTSVLVGSSGHRGVISRVFRVASASGLPR